MPEKIINFENYNNKTNGMENGSSTNPLKNDNEKLKQEVFENDLENKELTLDIINSPFIQKTLANYQIFSEAYFERKSDFKKVEKEKIKQRAEEIFKDDSDNLNESIYQDILKSDRPIKNDDFTKYIPIALLERLELKNELKKAKMESMDKFEEVLRKTLVERQIESARKKNEGREKIEKSKRPFERIGDLYVEIIGDECRPHIPRIATNWPETLKKMKESFEILAKLIQKDERFKNIKEINIISWIFGRENIAKDFDNLFKWASYTKEEIEKIAEKDSYSYKETQKVGAKASPREFKKYLLTG